jgi:hypothetical protein
MDKLTFCNNYLYSCGQVISLMMSVLSQKICVLIVPVCRNESNERWIELELSMRTDSKETMINKPPSHLFTDVARFTAVECSQTLIIRLSN